MDGTTVVAKGEAFTKRGAVSSCENTVFEIPYSVISKHPLVNHLFIKLLSYIIFINENMTTVCLMSHALHEYKAVMVLVYICLSFAPDRYILLMVLVSVVFSEYY